MYYSLLDDETEEILKQVTKETGWSVSTTLKRGILTLRDEVSRRAQRSKFTAALISDQADIQSRLRPTPDTACSSRYVENPADNLRRYRTVDELLRAWRSLRP